MRKALLSTLVIATAAVGGPAMAAGASPASQPAAAPAASCANPPDGLRTINYVTNISRYYRPTKVVSPYYGSRTTGVVDTTTRVTITANLSAQVKANFGFWKLKLLKADAHASVTATYSRSTHYQAQMLINPKRGYKGRIMLYHEIKRFTAGRKTWSPSRCGYVTIFATRNSAPIAGLGGMLYQTQYVRK